jgi:hypothetical protein
MNSKKVAQLLQGITQCSTITVEELKKILKKVRIDNEKGCWIYNEDWSVYVTYKKHLLHRLMYRIFKEEIRGKSSICHRCDRPGCINPEHLFQGTNRDNINDAIKKGRRFNNLIAGGKHLRELRRRYQESVLETPIEFLRVTYANRTRIRRTPRT